MIWKNVFSPSLYANVFHYTVLLHCFLLYKCVTLSIKSAAEDA